MNTSVNTAICISIEDIQFETKQDADLQRLKSYIIEGWSQKRQHGTKYAKVLANQA